jgi:hypothetical protein
MIRIKPGKKASRAVNRTGKLCNEPPCSKLQDISGLFIRRTLYNKKTNHYSAQSFHAYCNRRRLQ